MGKVVAVTFVSRSLKILKSEKVKKKNLGSLEFKYTNLNTILCNLSKQMPEVHLVSLLRLPVFLIL